MQCYAAVVQMGTATSRPYVECDDAFRESVLLVNAPLTLFGTPLHEGPWSFIHNAQLEVVRWDGGITSAERQRRAAGSHVAVIYFCDPTERTRMEADERMQAVLGHVLDTTDNTTRVFACLYGAFLKDERKPPINFEPKELITSLARSRPVLDPPVKERVKIRYLYDETAWLQLQTDISLSILPRKMQRPLMNLARDMVEATEATDVILLQSLTMLPLIAYSTCCIPAEVPQRVAKLIKPLLDTLMPFLQYSGSRLRSFDVEHEIGFVSCRVAVTPDVHMLLIVPANTATGATGLSLIKINMTHYAMHFANVLKNTSERRTFNPIMPDD